MSDRIVPPRGGSGTAKVFVVGPRLVGTVVCPAGVYALYVQNFPDRDPNLDLETLESLRSAFARGDTFVLGNLYTLKQVGRAPGATEPPTNPG